MFQDRVKYVNESSVTVKRVEVFECLKNYGFIKELCERLEEQVQREKIREARDDLFQLEELRNLKLRFFQSKAQH